MSIEQDSPQSHQQPEMQNQAAAEKRSWWRHPVAMTLIGAGAVASVVGIGIKATGSESNPTPEAPKQTVSASKDPVPTPGETPAPAVNELDGLSAAEFNNDTEAIVNAYYADLKEFYIAGATKEAADADERYEIGNDGEYVDTIISPEIDADFLSNYFIPNWQENSNLVTYVEGILSNAKSARWARITTQDGGPGNVEQYERGYIIESIETTGDPLKASTRWSQYDNRDMNMADEGNLGGDDINTFTGGDTITWVKVGDKLLIRDVTYNDGE